MFTTSHFHPMLVHFPIALIAVGFLAELVFLFYKKEICLTKIGLYLLVLGALSAIAAWGAGQLFTGEMEGAAGQVRETHELFATATLVFALITSILRIYLEIKKIDKKSLKQLAFVLYALTAVCVFATGFFGGTLVYNYIMPL